MAKIVVGALISKVGDKNSVVRKTVKDATGKRRTLRILDAGSETFSSDLTYVFSKNVATARQENRQVAGKSDLAPARK